MKQTNPRFSRKYRSVCVAHLFLVALAATIVFVSSSVEPIPSSAAANVLGAITVNTTSDVTNGSDGFCTLREAITSANNDAASGATPGECAAGSGPDTINITGVTGTITLTTALPAIATDMTLNGPGASQLTVSGNNSFRVFYITLSGPGIVNFSGLTIANGLATMNVGGGIYNEHDATVNVSNSTISNNSAVLGGGLANSSNGPFTITNCTVISNSAGTAGGIYNGLGPFNVINSTLTTNTASGGSGNGGGINTGSGTLSVVNSTFHNNGAAGGGGAIYKNGSGSITVTNSTFTNNSASSGGAINNASGTSPQVRNTIIALNSAGSGPDVFGSFTSQGHNLIGMNDGSSGFTAGTSNPNGDRVGTVATPINPMLAALANNGGPTQTRALIQGSTAIDAGDNCVLNNSCVPALGSAITTDQRGTGFGRALDGSGDGIATVDIGAYEFAGLLVTNTNDSGAGSLRQAIIDANANSDSSAINFQSGLTGTISLSTALPDLSTSMAINGPGAGVLTVQRSTAGGTPDFRVFTIPQFTTASLSGLTISNGRLPTNQAGGGVSNRGTLTMTDCNVYGNNLNPVNFDAGGGGLFNAGALTLHNCNFGGTEPGQGNGSNGSGAGLSEFGTLTMTGGSISGNFGSGLNVTNSLGGTTLINVKISSNTVFSGSGVGVSGALTLINCLVSNNSVTQFGGGGIDVEGGVLDVINTTISGNTSGQGGGGIRQANNGVTRLVNVTITNNRSDSDNSGGEHGGGIDNQSGTMTLANTIVTGNFRGGSPLTTADDIVGLIAATSSFNLIGTGGSGGLTDGTNNNQVGVSNPKLGLLANNGGPTMTHALLAGSPAVDGGTDIALTTLNGATDNLQTTINVVDASIFSATAGFTILSDSEQMVVTNKTGNMLTVTRGANSTTAAAHANGAQILAAFDQRGFFRRRDGADDGTVATVDIGAFEAQAAVEDLTDKSIAEDNALAFGFNVGDAAAITNVTASSSNTTLVPNLPANLSVTGSGSTRTLNITPGANQYGTSTITVTVTSGSESMSDTFVLTVTAVPDTPSVTPATTNEDVQTSSGLVVSRNAADGSEVTHFKITNITSGTLFKNNGVTQITNGDIITFAEGSAGLKFTPAANLFSPTTAFGFNVQAATDASGSGLSPAATATITVTPIADTPSVTSATTTVNTQTTSGLVLSRNAADSTEVTHFKITNITNGTLFKNNGTTEITNDSFITFAEGNAGLKFKPANNLVSPTSVFSFQVQGATSSGGAGLGSAATAAITVDCGPTVVTNTNDNGAGSLRSIINSACSGATITFAAALTSVGPATVTLTSGELLIDKNLTINGPGANLLTVMRSTAGGTPAFRIFNIPSSTVNLSGLKISGGSVDSPGFGGGISNGGTLTLTNITVNGNASGLAGGGIYDTGTLILNNSTISGNTSSGAGGGIYVDGGMVTVRNSTVSSNNGGAGGGITNQYGTVALIDSTVSNNTGSAGGGIYNTYTGATLTLTNCTVSNNISTSFAGGIFNNYNLTLTNSTVSGNTAEDFGGGIYNYTGTLRLTNSTITKNKSNSSTGGGISNNPGLAYLGNTIVADNTSPLGGPDLNGSFISEDYNLIGNTTGATFTGTTPHNILNASANLGPLANNGGAQLTHLPLPGNPAINAGSNALLPADAFDLDGDSNTAEVLPVDERGAGFNRIVNTTVDIGAVEVNYSITATTGSGQSAVINTAFATQLQATVKESGVNQSGIPVTFTAPASGPSGTFSASATVNTNGSGLATAPVFTANGTAGGPYNVVASLAGGSPSANFALTNLKGNQAITVNPHAPASATYNTSFTVAATSSSGLAVSYSSSGVCTNVGATFTMTSGTGTCTVKYDQAGDTNYNAATQVTESVTAQTATTTTNLSSSLNPSPFGQSVTFTAKVTSAAGTPTGTVTFKDNGVAITGCSNKTLASGQATCDASGLAAGNHPITADYSGDTNFATSIGTLAGGQVVTPPPSIQFSSTSYSKNESGPSTNITVTRTGDTSGASAVNFITGNNAYVPCNAVNGVTTQNCDFIIGSGTLNFAAGQTSRTFPIIIIDDLFVEGDETLSLSLSSPSSAVLGSPSTATLTIIDNDSVTPSTNPLDDARYFVRTHYYDFLGRLPDDGGLDYWSNEITQCGSNTACINERRVAVSNAFFYEQEYQQTASFVFLLYRASFGNNQPFPNPDFFDSNLSAALHAEAKKLPRYLSFARDRVQVVGGSDLAQTQLALANAFVQRPEFVTKYPLSLATAAQFVDAVLATIRNDSGAELVSQRDTLIGHFNTGGRGLVMFHLANDYWNGCNRLPGSPPAPCVPVGYGDAVDNRAFIDAEYNRSFVYSQYSGYLRRDGDIGGFLFWLTEVSKAPPRNVGKQHGMVCSFLTSEEYQRRFSSVVTHSNAECGN